MTPSTELSSVCTAGELLLEALYTLQPGTPTRLSPFIPPSEPRCIPNGEFAVVPIQLGIGSGSFGSSEGVATPSGDR